MLEIQLNYDERRDKRYRHGCDEEIRTALHEIPEHLSRVTGLSPGLITDVALIVLNSLHEMSGLEIKDGKVILTLGIKPVIYSEQKNLNDHGQCCSLVLN